MGLLMLIISLCISEEKEKPGDVLGKLLIAMVWPVTIPFAIYLYIQKKKQNNNADGEATKN